jgi:uncharacterized protein YegL
MNEKLTEIACLIDRSGSMNHIRSDALDGFNAFLEGQKKVGGEARLSLVLFNDTYELVQECVDIQDVPELDETTYTPGGSTALLDAIGRTIDDIGKRLSDNSEEERPGKVIVAVLTDGLENASRVYTSYKVSDMIRHQEEAYNWEFIYLGANQDAVLEAQKLSIRASNAVSWDSDSQGTRVAFNRLSADVRKRRVSHRKGKNVKK